ncbi:glycerol-3-phosphate dehydrogenase [candidate division TA06 bacterium]|uniref:Glycerol-3-phosphate dehydrogenase [NAD(P)+] n=1 Tax=candidate division TA06 bacterium TaxID=2250710 RepID=A0A660SPW9_UNCT6|nr:MAG: glycerol-3-phosphate dehydrogenase [candidate division TA06 bacterium]
MNISVLGAGNWGTTLAIVAGDNGHSVMLWEIDRKNYESIEKYRENKKYLPGIYLPKTVIVSNSIKDIVDFADIVLFVVPSVALRQTALKIKNLIQRDTILVSASKGLENGTQMRMSEILKEIFPENSVVALSGPSIANEVADKKPTAIVAASISEDAAKSVQYALSNEYLRIYKSTDVIGVELGGALKNVIVIAAGILDGMGLGDNTKATLITRGLAEITRLGVKLGAKKETFAGLSGIGDLFVTATSKHSRNRYVGEKIGKGMRLDDILKSMYMVAEGINTASVAKKLGDKHKISMPITKEVNNILFNDKDRKQIVIDLMKRSLKDENG